MTRPTIQSAPQPTQPTIVDYAFARMDPEIAASFSENQRQALATVLAPRRHAVNLRLSFPYGFGRGYLVVLAGQERRDSLRHPETAPHPLWTPLALAILLGAMGSGIAVFMGLLQVNEKQLSKLVTPSVAPAAIPFKADAESCRESGRIWQDNHCLDYDHDATF